jgi:hypothetical protein
LSCDLTVPYFRFPPFKCLSAGYFFYGFHDPTDCRFTCWIPGFLLVFVVSVCVLTKDRIHEHHVLKSNFACRQPMCRTCRRYIGCKVARRLIGFFVGVNFEISMGNRIWVYLRPLAAGCLSLVFFWPLWLSFHNIFLFLLGWVVASVSFF